MQKPQTPAESPFDVKQGWAWRFRWARNLLATLVVGIAFADYFGLPHLAWEYQCYRRPVEIGNAYQATYYGPLGRRVVRHDQHGSGMSWIKWLPIEPPIRRRLFDQCVHTIDHLAGRVDDHRPILEEPRRGFVP